jgi:hypothetical protein
LVASWLFAVRLRDGSLAHRWSSKKRRLRRRASLRRHCGSHRQHITEDLRHPSLAASLRFAALAREVSLIVRCAARQWSVAESLAIAAISRQKPLVHRWKSASSAVASAVIICGIPAAKIVGPSLGHAATVVGGIVDGCGNLAATIVDTCGKHRWRTSNEC